MVDVLAALLFFPTIGELDFRRRQLSKSQVAAFAGKYRPPLEQAKAKERRDSTLKKGDRPPASEQVREREIENGKAAQIVANEVGVLARGLSRTPRKS